MSSSPSQSGRRFGMVDWSRALRAFVPALARNSWLSSSLVSGVSPLWVSPPHHPPSHLSWHSRGNRERPCSRWPMDSIPSDCCSSELVRWLFSREPNREALVADSQSSSFLAKANCTPAAPQQVEGAKRMSACYPVFSAALCFPASGLFLSTSAQPIGRRGFRGRGDAKFSFLSSGKGGRPLAGPSRPSHPCSGRSSFACSFAWPGRAARHTTRRHRTGEPGFQEAQPTGNLVGLFVSSAALRPWRPFDGASWMGLCAVGNGRLEWPFWVLSGVHRGLRALCI